MSEPVLYHIYVPLILSILLFAGSEIPMSFFVHLLDFNRVLPDYPIIRVNELLGSLTVDGGETEGVILLVFDVLRPGIVPLETLEQGLSNVRCILLLLDVIKSTG
jgi:hypothetical protein